MSPRLLHVADIHLDKPFGWLGSKGGEQRTQLKQTFRALVDLALAERVDAVLVAGDLFDSNWPSQDTIDLVRAQLRRLTVPVFILPGTHDCLDEGSIYRKVDIAGSDGSHIHVFDGRQRAFDLDALDLTVHGRANLTKTSVTSPLEGITRNPATRFNVAMAHGSLVMPGTENDFPISPSDLSAAAMDYVALGHWHRYQECPTPTGKACYCGPPELLADGEHGFALLVDLAHAGVTLEQRAIGRRKYRKESVALDGLQTVEEVRERIRGLSDPDLVLSVVLTGLRSLGLVLDPTDLSRDLSGAFFALKVEDRSHPTLSPEELAAFPEKLVIGQFIRRMATLIEQSNDPRDRRVREAALQIGVALLQGRKVL
ncbi:MAG: DNA repair exonuclease [Chloroflexi bacterium]|nr:DNA repair exonuclease [Chloroflexota bacterium]